MIELIIGLVAVLALFAALVQLATSGQAGPDGSTEPGLAKAQNDALAAARLQAGLWSISDTTLTGNPEYIRYWQDGPDSSPYTADDTSDRASLSAFQETIVNRAVADPADWPLLDSMPHNYISRLHNDQLPTVDFGLIGNTTRRQVTLIPAVRHLLYNADEVTVEAEAWSAWTKGIY